ncbi:expressed protein, partial [Phakopsora pachyrhizi]
MLTLQLYLIFYFSRYLISWGRGVEGAILKKSFGDEGEYLSLSSVSNNSKDLLKFQQNINDDKQNCIIHPKKPLSRDFFKQIAEENNKLKPKEISLQSEWENRFNPTEYVIQFENQHKFQHGGSMLPHSDYMIREDSVNQSQNFQETLNFFPQISSYTAQVEDLRFSGLNHQKETYPDPGPSKYQTLSSKATQPMIDVGFHNTINFNLASYLDENLYPNHSTVSQAYRNFDAPNTELTLGNPAFHFIQKDSIKNLHVSEVRDRVYNGNDNEYFEVSKNPNTESSFQNSGSRNNFKDDENSILFTSKKRKRKSKKAERELKESIKERLDLLRILEKNFSIGSMETLQNDIIFESKSRKFLLTHKKDPEKEAKYQKFIDKSILNFLHKDGPKEDQQPNCGIAPKVKEKFTQSEISLLDNRKRSRIIESAFRIQWNGFESLKKDINELASNFGSHKEADIHEGPSLHIKNISTLGITFMKIIAKKYPKGQVSKEFEDDQRLLEYSKIFWKFCFMDHKKMKEGLKDFFKSIRGDSSKRDIDYFLSTNLSKEHHKPDKIFSIIKTRITKKTDRKQILLFSWYFVFFRTMVYYPELFFKGSLGGNWLKMFIEKGIMYFIQRYDKILS